MTLAHERSHHNARKSDLRAHKRKLRALLTSTGKLYLQMRESARSWHGSKVHVSVDDGLREVGFGGGRSVFAGVDAFDDDAAGSL